MYEQNIKPTCIAGSSAGAIVGAMYSFGKKPEEILESLDELNKGGAPMSRYIAKKVVMVFQNKPQQHKLAELTTRENEILNKVSTGININELADNFSISPLTVKCHLRNIYSKLHVTNRVEAINKLNNNNDRNFF